MYCTNRGPCDEERCYCHHENYNTEEDIKEELRIRNILTNAK